MGTRRCRSARSALLLFGKGGPGRSPIPINSADPGLLIQIWSSAFSLFPAFDFVFPFPHTARFPFSPGRRENGFR